MATQTASDDWEADPCAACDGACEQDDLSERVERILATPIPKPSIGRTPDAREEVPAMIVAADRRVCD